MFNSFTTFAANNITKFTNHMIAVVTMTCALLAAEAKADLVTVYNNANTGTGVSSMFEGNPHQTGGSLLDQFATMPVNYIDSRPGFLHNVDFRFQTLIFDGVTTTPNAGLEYLNLFPIEMYYWGDRNNTSYESILNNSGGFTNVNLGHITNYSFYDTITDDEGRIFNLYDTSFNILEHQIPVTSVLGDLTIVLDRGADPFSDFHFGLTQAGNTGALGANNSSLLDFLFSDGPVSLNTYYEHNHISGSVTVFAVPEPGSGTLVFVAGLGLCLLYRPDRKPDMQEA